MKSRFGELALFLLAVFAVGSITMPASRRTAVASTAGRVVATGDTTAPRFSHTATLLPNGKVLIAGGMERNGVFLATAELYDPATGRFAPAGRMGATRGFGSTATLLPNGKVLITGGRGNSSCNASAELYDSATSTFTPTGSLTTPRCSAAAALLQTGSVLIIGGDQSPDADPQVSAELYDPSTGAFTATGSMRTPRDYYAAVLMKDGKVLVVGGSSAGQRPNTKVEASAEVYNPSTGRFAPTGGMRTPRVKFGAALLPDGRVLIVGGQMGGPWAARLATTEIYDPATGTFIPGPNMGFKRFKIPAAVVPLRNRRILLAGGADQPEVYDPVSSSLLPTAGSKLDSFYFSTATVLSNGEVLIVGGYGPHPGGGAVNHAWLYQP
jgi:Galactose oxidase, central domain/Kelch motif